MLLLRDLEHVFEEAIRQVFSLSGPIGSKVRVSSQKNADYQCDYALGAAKQLGKSPRAIAELIVGAVQSDLIESLEIAGPGFINIRLKDAYLTRVAVSIFTAFEQQHWTEDSAKKRIIVDYSGPNVAKEMHVGHLRSTILGDAIVRILSFQGHEVIRQNHLGDWGTQFGMLIQYLLEHEQADQDIAELNGLYRAAKAAFDADEAFATRARARVVQLQAGDEETLQIWQRIVSVSQAYFSDLYRRLDTLLINEDFKPESFYNPVLSSVVDELRAKGLLTKSDGAECIFPAHNVDETVTPLIVQKSDGGYLYATTDLAAIRYRTQELKADQIVYVTDARQKQHFAQVFEAAERMGWIQAGQAVHVPFGTMLGADGKPFKTRSGDVVKLVDLLNEAEEQVRHVVREKLGDVARLTDEDIRSLAIGAIKYADLLSDRERDYVFHLSKMVALEGNTAPYIQYCHVRTKAILAKQASDIRMEDLKITQPEEHALLVEIERFGEVLENVTRELRPHLLCEWLLGVASAFNSFYERCKVLDDDASIQRSRVALTRLASSAFANGLSLLGIRTVSKM